jgi:acetyltransferase
VPGIIHECVEAGVEGAIIISAGFWETGPEGAELERQVLEEARRGRMRIIGPNCLGVMKPPSGLNATFAGAIARSGNVAFLSQSGALLTAILDQSFMENVGFSALVSVGSMMDVGWGDLIYYLGDDPETKSIVIYMESVGDARSFLSAAREVALTKPIIVIKAGRTEAAGKAAASHTGSLTGSDEVLDAAFRRSGVLRVDEISELFGMAEVLGKQPRPRGPRLTILTNAGGPAVLATDALIGNGGELAQISPETMEALNEFLPAPWSHGNPIDVLGDADPERYAKTLETAAGDPQSDGLLVVLTPQDMTDPTATAERLAPYANSTRKPVLASWMGGPAVAAGESILNGAGIPTFDYPDTAARAFTNMWKYTYNLRSIYETPEPAEDEDADRERVEEIIARVRDSGRTILTEFEAKQVLAAYDIPTVETEVARSPDEAVELADRLGYPVVLKLNSETITHKTDVGGVRLNLRSADEVRRAYEELESSIRENYGPEDFGGAAVQRMVGLDGYELIVGSSLDPQFGPVLLFAARRGAALDQGARHKPAPCLAGEPDGPRRPRRTARSRDEGGGPPAHRDPALPETVRLPRGVAQRHPGNDTSDPPRGRAPDGQVPRDALRRERLHALLPHDEPRPAHGPRAPDPHLLYRLRPRDGAGRRADGPRDGGT